MGSILFKIVNICNSQFKCNYLKNEKRFSDFLFHFSSLHQILNILKEKICVIGNVFPKLETLKNLVRTLSKKHSFRTRFYRQHVKASQILATSLWQRFYHVFSSFSLKLIWKMFPLVLDEISEVSVNTLTADGKYFVHDFENLPLKIQMHYRKNKKLFLYFLFHFWNLHKILNVFKKRVIAIANVFPKSQTLKNFVRSPSKKCCFRTGFESQHVKASQILAKSQWECFYHGFSSF